MKRDKLKNSANQNKNKDEVMEVDEIRESMAELHKTESKKKEGMFTDKIL